MSHYTDVIHADEPYLYYSTNSANGIGAAPTIGSQVTVDDVDWIGDEPVLSFLGLSSTLDTDNSVTWYSPGFNTNYQSSSVEYWVKAPPTAKTRAYMHFCDGGAGFYRTASRIDHTSPPSGMFTQMGVVPDSLLSDYHSPEVDDNQWHHIVFTNSATKANVYVDGILRKSSSITINQGASAPILFGRQGNATSSNNTLTGKMAHMAVYHYELSPEQIAEHYSIGLYGPPDPYEPISYSRTATDYTLGNGANSRDALADPTFTVPDHHTVTALSITYSYLQGSASGSRNIVVNPVSAKTATDGVLVDSVSFSGNQQQTSSYTWTADAAELELVNNALTANDGYAAFHVYWTGWAANTNASITDVNMTLEYIPSATIEVAPAEGSAMAVMPAMGSGYAVPAMTVAGGMEDVAVSTDQILAAAESAGTAEMLSPTLNPDLGYVVDFKATSVHWSNNYTSGNEVNSERVEVNDYGSGRATITFPSLNEVLPVAQDSVKSFAFIMQLDEVYNTEGTVISVYPNGDLLRRFSFTTKVGANRIELDHDVTSLRIHTGTQRIRFDNPKWEDNSDSYFTVTAVADPGAYPNHEAFVADAQMLGASVDTTADVSIAVAPFDVLGTVGNVIFPDWDQQVSAATGAAEMEDAWFKSDRSVAVDAIAVEGELLTATTATDNNIVVEADYMAANGYAFDPDEVNQDMGDRFFDEIAKDNPYSWYRLNERINEGTNVWRHSPGGRVTADKRGPGETASDIPYQMTGQFTRGIVTGPGGRKAVDIENAHLPIRELPGWRLQLLRSPDFETSSFEIVFKTEQANGLIAYGNFEIIGHIGQYAGSASVRLELVDGYLEGMGLKSLTRVNDGQWHHVVIQHSDRGAYSFPGRPQDYRPGMELWIDGRLDRTVIYKPDSHTAHPLASYGPRFDRLFSLGSIPGDASPFRGQVMEFAVYQGRLHRDRVLEHYRALNDIIPVRAPVVGAAVGASGDHKVESNMRRMLILNFSRTWGYHASGRSTPLPLFSSPGKSGENRSGLPMEHQFGKDWIPNVLESVDVTDDAVDAEDHGELGDLQITYQRVEMVHDSETVKQGWSAVGWDEEERGNNGVFRYFIDTFTGEKRFINLQQDIVDLEDYDIIYVQGYPNWTLRDQEDRLKAEAFLDSVNQAIIDGSKMWISNPLLAADLGLISRHEVVPTSLAYRSTLDGRLYYRGGVPIFESIYNKETSTIVDARSWQLMPWSDKEAPFEIPEGIETAAQMYAHLRQVAPTIVDNIGEIESTRYSEWDAWANNHYRVVNELEGLTDQPSYEITDAAFADRLRSNFASAEQYELQAYRYENRAGFDDPWGYTESKGTGLKAGDEFMDRHILMASLDGSGGINSINRGRGYITYAVPPGHLKAGRAITTFGQTIWQDNGKEGVNPYKDHITTAAVMPGDRINGQLVGGYVFMQFSENAHTSTKLQNLPIDRNPWIEDPDNTTGDDGLTDYARSWHYATLRKESFGRGSVQAWSGGSQRITPILDVFGGVTGYRVSGKAARSEMLPLAPKMQWRYGVNYVPNATWTFRGIRWLMDATPKLVGAVNTLANASTGTASMRDATIYSEKDNNISVAPANAYGILLPSDNVTGKDAQNFVLAATGTARIVDPGKTIFVEPMTAIGDMGSQNIARIELGEINWLTLNRNRDLIELRVEEIGASTSSLLTIPGEVITTGGN